MCHLSPNSVTAFTSGSESLTFHSDRPRHVWVYYGGHFCGGAVEAGRIQRKIGICCIFARHCAGITLSRHERPNGVSEGDTSIIPTCLAPEKFAELNVIGQWLGIEDVIDRYYDDQINQAVGRNRCFRRSEQRPTTTRVITSSRLWQQVLRKGKDRHRRSQLYIAERG